MLTAILLMAIAGGSTLETASHTRVDDIELHYVYMQSGELNFQQFIYWRWDRHWSERHVVDWHIRKKGGPVPFRTKTGWRIFVTLDKRMLVIDSSTYHVCHQYQDVEIEQRERLRISDRSKLNGRYSTPDKDVDTPILENNSE